MSSCLIVYWIKFKEPYCRSYDPKVDTVPLVYIIAPCAILALLINDYFGVFEVLWTFSIDLEAVAIVPQLVVVHAFAKAHNGFVESLTSDYVFCLGGYRAMYLFNWIYRLATEPGYSNWIVWVAGIVQTGIYCDFFYYYVKR
jgi:ER lumen protein retaining receptor